jgi:hypothetical protein
VITLTLSEILNLAVAITGLILSVIAIIISISTFSKQTRMELFEKRFDIYYACLIICGCCSIGQPEMPIATLENRGIKFGEPYTGTVKFLFDKKTSDQIYEITSQWNLMRTYQYFADKDADIEAKYNELKTWFSTQKDSLDDLFAKYLKQT